MNWMEIHLGLASVGDRTFYHCMTQHALIVTAQHLQSVRPISALHKFPPDLGAVQPTPPCDNLETTRTATLGLFQVFITSGGASQCNGPLRRGLNIVASAV